MNAASELEIKKAYSEAAPKIKKKHKCRSGEKIEKAHIKTNLQIQMTIAKKELQIKQANTDTENTIKQAIGKKKKINDL